MANGEALFTALDKVSTPEFQDGLKKAERAIDILLNLISARLGLDHDRVLGSRYSFPVMARYLMQRGGHLTDYRERDKLLPYTPPATTATRSKKPLKVRAAVALSPGPQVTLAS